MKKKKKKKKALKVHQNRERALLVVSPGHAPRCGTNKKKIVDRS